MRLPTCQRPHCSRCSVLVPKRHVLGRKDVERRPRVARLTSRLGVRGTRREVSVRGRIAHRAFSREALGAPRGSLNLLLPRGGSMRSADAGGLAPVGLVRTLCGHDVPAGQAAASSQQPEGWSNGRGCPSQSGGGLRKQCPSGAYSPGTPAVFGVGDEDCRTPRSLLRSPSPSSFVRYC